MNIEYFFQYLFLCGSHSKLSNIFGPVDTLSLTYLIYVHVAVKTINPNRLDPNIKQIMDRSQVWFYM